jgi:hypothetical protein
MKARALAPVLLIGLCGAAQAGTAVFECKRADAVQTVYLKIDEDAKGALIADDLKTARDAAPQPADDFNALEVDFKQFVKYSFDRITLTLTKKSIGVSDTFHCTRSP